MGYPFNLPIDPRLLHIAALHHLPKFELIRPFGLRLTSRVRRPLTTPPHVGFAHKPSPAALGEVESAARSILPDWSSRRAAHPRVSE